MATNRRAKLGDYGEIEGVFARDEPVVTAADLFCGKYHTKGGYHYCSELCMKLGYHAVEDREEGDN